MLIMGKRWVPAPLQTMEAQGRFRWPRNSDEVKTLTWQQFDWLMSGLEIEQPKAFRVPEDTGGMLSA